MNKTSFAFQARDQNSLGDGSPQHPDQPEPPSPSRERLSEDEEAEGDEADVDGDADMELEADDSDNNDDDEDGKGDGEESSLSSDDDDSGKDDDSSKHNGSDENEEDFKYSRIDHEKFGQTAARSMGDDFDADSFEDRSVTNQGSQMANEALKSHMRKFYEKNSHNETKGLGYISGMNGTAGPMKDFMEVPDRMDLALAQ